MFSLFTSLGLSNKFCLLLCHCGGWFLPGGLFFNYKFPDCIIFHFRWHVCWLKNPTFSNGSYIVWMLLVDDNIVLQHVGLKTVIVTVWLLIKWQDYRCPTLTFLMVFQMVWVPSLMPYAVVKILVFCRSKAYATANSTVSCWSFLTCSKWLEISSA